MIVVLLLSVMGAALVQVQAARTRQQVSNTDNVRALYIAEAGLSEAFLAVSEGKTGNVGAQSQPASFGDGYYWVEAAQNDDGQVALVSNALCGVGRFSIALILQREVNAVGALGMFGEDSLRVGTGAVIDGFDSRTGTFDQQVDLHLPGSTTGEGAMVGSNGDIRLTCTQPLPVRSIHPPPPPPPVKTVVYGDVQPGPASAVVTDPGAVVTGSTRPAGALSDLPTIDVPLLPVVTIAPVGTVTGTASYRTILVKSGKQLIIRGPATLVIGTFTLQPSATLVFDSSAGAISIHCVEALSFAAGSTIRSTRADATRCALLVSAADGRDRTGDGLNDPAILLASGGEFYGSLYAPAAAVSVPSGLRVFGSIVAMSLEMRDGSRLTYDRSLAFEGGGLVGLPQLISWSIVALPDTPIVDMRVNPSEMMAANGIVPIPSSEAHMERSFDVQYLDRAGTAQTYNGPPKNIDWTDVRKLISWTWYDRNGRQVDAFAWFRRTLDKPVKTSYNQVAVDGDIPTRIFRIVRTR